LEKRLFQLNRPKKKVNEKKYIQIGIIKENELKVRSLWNPLLNYLKSFLGFFSKIPQFVKKSPWTNFST
jgi:hypothetical protein